MADVTTLIDVDDLRVTYHPTGDEARDLWRVDVHVHGRDLHTHFGPTTSAREDARRWATAILASESCRIAREASLLADAAATVASKAGAR